MPHSKICKDPRCRGNHTNHAKDTRMELTLLYIDKKHDIELEEGLKSPQDISIEQLTREFLMFLCLEHIPPEHIRLIGFSRDDRYRQLDIKDIYTRIRDLGITSGCTLYFEPTPGAAPPQPCRLRVTDPDDVEKVDFEWYREKTTLGMLFEFVVKRFSLASVQPERIHLLTINDELDLWSLADVRLSKFGLNNNMSIFVRIIPSLTSMNENENQNVHVQCICDNKKFTFDIPNTETIGEVKAKVQRKYEDRQIIGFKLSNANNEECDTNDPSRTLKSFGIKPGQTISTSFCLIKQDVELRDLSNESGASSKASSSSNTKAKRERVTVICQYPSGSSETFEIPITNTVNQVIEKVESHTHGQRLVISKMHSKDINIDFKNEKTRTLAELGYKHEDIIDVVLANKSPVHTSIISKKPPSSPKEDKRSKARPVKLKPMGLDNLGNSCYMNSALQCIAHVPQLTELFLQNMRHAYMDDGEHTDNDWNPYDQVGDITGAYSQLLWYLWRCDLDDDVYESFKPERIRQKIASKDARFATNDQQDVQEFMTFFLDTLHQELKTQNKNQRNTIIKQLFFGEIASTITCTACNKEETTKHPISFLSIPLNRHERRIYIHFIPKKGEHDEVPLHVPMSCRIENVVDQFTRGCKRPELFHYILAMLPDGELDFKMPLREIPTDELIFMEQEDQTKNPRPEPSRVPAKISTLEDCLKDFFSPETLEDGWTCPQKSCQRKTTATKQMKLSTLPPILIIQFKRFLHENGFHQKVETFVDYPIVGLNLNKFLPSLQEEAIYDLIAVSIHMGSIVGGHYTTYARHKTPNKTEWYKFDDSCVTLIKPDDYNYEIKSRHAYLLFYIKREFSSLETAV